MKSRNTGYSEFTPRDYNHMKWTWYKKKMDNTDNTQMYISLCIWADKWDGKFTDEKKAKGEAAGRGKHQNEF